MSARTNLCIALALAAVCAASAVRTAPVAHAPVAKVGGDAVICELCDYAASWADSYLKANGTEEEVTNFVVNDVCPKLPEEYAGMCASYAPMALSYAFQYVENALETGKVCSLLDCDSKTDAAKVFGLPDPAKYEVAPLRDTCDMCEKAATKIHDFLSQPGEIDKIVSFVEEVCALVPADDHDKCVSTVTGFGPMVLNYVVGLTANPQQACETISLC